MCVKVITRALQKLHSVGGARTWKQKIWSGRLTVRAEQSIPQEKEILLPHYFLQENPCFLKQRSAITTKCSLSTLAHMQLLLRTSYHTVENVLTPTEQLQSVSWVYHNSSKISFNISLKNSNVCREFWKQACFFGVPEKVTTWTCYLSPDSSNILICIPRHTLWTKHQQLH